MRSYDKITPQLRTELLSKPRKYVTFSFDDGNTQDKILLDLLNKYGARATFNLNTGLFGWECKLPAPQDKVSHLWMREEEVFSGIYDGHELAAHTLHHPELTKMSDDEIIYEIKKDAENIANHLGFDTIGMAYPGDNYSPADFEKIKTLVLNNTTIRYIRFFNWTYKFDMPTNWFKWEPSVMWCDPELITLADKLIEAPCTENMLLYCWGHSYEMDCPGALPIIEEALKHLVAADSDDIVFVTNGAFYQLFGPPDDVNSVSIQPGIYRHFKGNEYQVLCMSTDSETLEPMVCYRALYGDRKVWVRPAKMWNDLVDVNGEKVKRFTLIS